TAVLQVPSAVVVEEWNFLLNPAHPDFRRFQLSPPRPYSFDRRLARTRKRKPDYVRWYERAFERAQSTGEIRGYFTRRSSAFTAIPDSQLFAERLAPCRSASGSSGVFAGIRVW